MTNKEYKKPSLNSEESQLFVQNLGFVLNEMRKDRSLTQKQVGEGAKSTLSTNQINKLFSGMHGITSHHLWDVFHSQKFDIIDAIERAIVMTERELKIKK
jgi:hypothetical protein